MKKIKCFKCREAIKNQSIYGLHTDCFQQWFAVQDSSEFYNLDFKKARSYSSSPTVKFTKNKDSFYHGRYHKYSAKLGDRQYILKVEESKFPDLPAMEYLCNQIASHLGLKVPSYYLIQFNDISHINQSSSVSEQENVAEHLTSVGTSAPHRQDIKLPLTAYQQSLLNPPESKRLTNQKEKPKNLMAFVTKNFMQDCVGVLNHIYKFLPKGDKHYNCQNIVNVIEQQTNQPNDLNTFVKICLFDAFIGNRDRHGRNLGIIDTGKKKRLAPMYDNPSDFGITPEEMLGHQFNISGCIWTTSSKEPKIKDYVYEFKRLNLENPCLKFIEQIIKQFPFLIEETKKSEISDNRKTAFIRFLNNRLQDLKNV